MIPWRRIVKWAFFSRMAGVRLRASQGSGRGGQTGCAVNSLTSQLWSKLGLVPVNRARSAVHSWRVRQSFDAFGNDLAELHHLLAQAGVVYNFAMDAIAIGSQFFAQVA
jgi:hypothetical protein